MEQIHLYWTLHFEFVLYKTDNTKGNFKKSPITRETEQLKKK